MDNKHTPGPWQTAGKGYTDATIYDSEGEIWLATACHDHAGAYSGKPCPGFPTNDQCEANAHLIAAAPDLLLALENVLAICENQPDKLPPMVLSRAKDAIAKAVGS